MNTTINTGKVNSYIVQKTIGGWVVCWLNEDHSIRNVDGGKVHNSRQNAYAKAKRLNDAIKNQPTFVDCATCGKPAFVEDHNEGGEYGWTRHSYTCTHCGYSEPDISLA